MSRHTEIVICKDIVLLIMVFGWVGLFSIVLMKVADAKQRGNAQR